MKAIKTVQKTIAQISLIISAIMLASVAIAVLLSVLDRFIIKQGMMWTEQYARYMLIWSVFLSSNVLIYRNDLMRVDFMDAFWPAGMKKVREGLYTALFIIMLSILFYQGCKQAINYIGVSLMGIPVDKFWVYLSIPVGAGLMMIQYLLNLVCIVFSKKEEKAE